MVYWGNLRRTCLPSRLFSRGLVPRTVCICIAKASLVHRQASVTQAAQRPNSGRRSTVWCMRPAARDSKRQLLVSARATCAPHHSPLVACAPHHSPLAVAKNICHKVQRNTQVFFFALTCTDLQASVPTRWRARVTRACRPRRPFDRSDVRGGSRREKHHTAASIAPAPFASATAAAAAAAGKPADCPFWGVRAASPGAHCRVLCRTSARKTALCAAACRDGRG